MLKNYFKIAWRNLLKNKALSFINIFGLAIGMAFAIVIGLWVRYELSFDQFHVNKDRIALLMRHEISNGEKITRGSTPLPLYEALKTNYPEVKRATRISWQMKHSLVFNDKKLNKSGIYVDPDFLKMFSFPLLEGNIDEALANPNSIILTEKLARTLFGDRNPLGKMVRMNNQFNVMVSGIIKDVPKNSSIDFEFLAPFDFRIKNDPFVKDSQAEWDNNFLLTAVELKEGTDTGAFSNKLKPLLTSRKKEIRNSFLFLHPLEKWHLEDDYKNWVNVGGKIDLVALFGIIGASVLLIACINFMNLSTARSEKRAREVGIRKSVGSKRSQLIIQFLSESLMTTFFAFLLAGGLVQLILPALKNIGFENVVFDLGDTSVLWFMLVICVATGLIAGSYPAIYLSSFVPVRVLKGAIIQGKAAVNLRKALVISQFVISISLIICTVIVFQQVNHARSRSLGYNPDNLVSVEASSDLAKNFDVLKYELLATGKLEAVAKSSSSMVNINNDWGGFSWEGKDPNSNLSMDVIMTDFDYEKTTGMKFKEGRPFSRNFKTDSNAVILNEAAVKLIGFKSPLGRTIKLGEQVLTIIGVTENVVISNPFQPVKAGVILFRKDNTNTVLLRLKDSAELREILSAIKPIFEKYNPSLPFEYTFADEEFGKKFELENQVATLAGVFAGLAILISCLGLLGLVSFMVERRSKEVGIRKVLGATIANVWLMLTREFVLLVLVACLIASPITIILMNAWLGQYEYRIDINPLVFVWGGLAAILIALATVSFQAIKAALANPVKSLRTE